MKRKTLTEAAITMIRIFAIGLFMSLGVFGLLLSRDSTGVTFLASAEPTPRPRLTRTPQAAKYSKFKHEIEAHKVECATCHKFPSSNWEKARATDPFPDVTEYPKHDSCLQCHAQQFFSGKPPAICAICHINPSPEDSRRHPFPNPREVYDKSPKGASATSAFGVVFPHDKHVDIVSDTGHRTADGAMYGFAGFRRAGEESCAVCHTTLNAQGTGAEEYLSPPPKNIGTGFWLKRGTFKSSPIGHQTCFTCHSADGLPPAPADCAACHKPRQQEVRSDFSAPMAAKMGVDDKLTLVAWKRREWSGKFRHEGPHGELSCSTCHDVTIINTNDPKTKRVKIASCSMCHATPSTADGGALNIEIAAKKARPAFTCAKCHVTNGKEPIPSSHAQALAEATGN